MRTNTPQYKHLKSRVSSTANQFSWWRMENRKKKTETAEVKRARRVIRTHERKLAAKENRYTKRLDALRERADEALLFKDEKAALAAVTRFEKAVATIKV